MSPAPASEESIVADLVSQWQRRHAEGQSATPAELCRDRPELLPELERRIAALEKMADLADAVQETLSFDTANSKPTLSTPADGPKIPGYEILGELGRGGMGVVYKARQTSLNRIVALKMILAGAHASQEATTRFLREAEIIAHLKHPHVVQVHELGSHQGNPFFCLEYLEGGSLADKLRGEPQPPAQTAQIVEVLARAVEAAHTQGIVHRDLKPANVLLTVEGTPKLTDFGLAKQGESGMTATGRVMGTPSYMAPEQAGGKTKGIGPAADIYALGAILYEMLTGRPPFKGTSALETLQMVVGIEPVPPRQLQPKVPRDLETICLKCLHKDAGRRYASAAALADDLKRFLAGEPILARPTGIGERFGRWCRRNPRLAGLSAAVVFLLSIWAATSSALYSVAARNERKAMEEAARADAKAKEAVANLEQANANFDLARQTVDRHFVEVSEDVLLKEPGMQRLRKKLMQASREFYQRFIEERKGDPALRMGLAAAYQRLAPISDAIDAKDEAVAYQKEAIRLYEELCKEDGANESVRYNLSHTYFNLGNFYFSMDRIGLAEAAFRRSIDLIEPLAAAKSNSATFVEQLVLSLHGLGRLLAQKKGDMVEAEKRFTRALESARNFSATHPENVLSYPTALSLWSLGILFLDIQRADKAVPLLEDARQLLVELTKQTPARPEHVNAMVGCLNSLAVALRHSGRSGDAEKTYEQVADMWKELVRKNPLVSNYQANWGIVSYNLGNLYRDSGRPAKAEEAYKKAREIQEKVVADFPALARAKRDLSETYFNLARLYTHLGRRDDGERMHRKVLEIRQQLCKEHPEALEFQALLAASLGNVASFYRTTGQPAKAEANYRKQIPIYKHLIERTPRNPDYKCRLGWAYNDLGRLFRPIGRYEDAEAAYREAIAIQETLVRDNPKSADYRVDLATTQNNLGNLYVSTSKKDKAEIYYRKAIRGHEALVKEYPNEPYYRQELARSYNGLGGLFLSAERFGDAEAPIRQSAEMLHQLMEKEPNSLAYRKEWASSLVSLCEIYNHSKKNTAAEALCNEMLPVLERLAHQYPKYVELTYLLGAAQRQMGQALSASRGDPGDAMRWYDRAIHTLEDAARKAPGNVPIRQVLIEGHKERSKHLLKLARAAAALRDLDRAIELTSKPEPLLTQAQTAARIMAKDHAATAAKADKLANESKASAFLAYNAACVHACSSAAVREDNNLSPAAKDKLAESYAKQAMEWFRKADASGYFKDSAVIEGLKTESDLAPLRTREDFKKWLSKLSKKP